MKYKGRTQSRNVEDRRSTSSGMPRVGGGIGCGTLILMLLAFFFLDNPLQVIDQLVPKGGAVVNQNQRSGNNSGVSYQGANDELGEFVAVTLKETENVWNNVFKQHFGQQYAEPVLVLFEGAVTSGCGRASAKTGPFYCPADSKLYVDLSFYNELKNRFKAPGDFAMAYVVAHEVGHHVQNLLGITNQVQSQRRKLSKKDYNELSVRLELQADFLAGVWAHHTQRNTGILEDGDIEEAIRAAHVIGDDHIQLQQRGYVVPGSFTHGTSDQRKRWFLKGYKTGDVNQGDTFSVNTRSL